MNRTDGGEKGGKRTAICVYKYNQKRTQLCANHVHTQSFCWTLLHMLYPYLHPYKWARTIKHLTLLALRAMQLMWPVLPVGFSCAAW